MLGPKTIRWLKTLLEPPNFVAVLLFLATAGLYCATRNLVIDARENAKIQLRAYVAPTGVDFENGVHLDLQNSGQTPADHVRIFSNWEPRTKGRRDELCRTFSFPERDQCPGDKSTAFLSRDGIMKTGNLRCSAISADNDRAVRGDADLVLYGRISYRDAFRQRRATTFCYLLDRGGAQACDCHNDLDPDE